MTARTSADLLASIKKDGPARITAALAGLRKIGREHHEYEIDFMRRCGLGSTEFARHRDAFLDHTVSVPTPSRGRKRVWFGDAKVAAQLRSTL